MGQQEISVNELEDRAIRDVEEACRRHAQSLPMGSPWKLVLRGAHLMLAGVMQVRARQRV